MAENLIDRLLAHPATAEQHGIKDQGFISPADWHEIRLEIRPARMRGVVDGEFTIEPLP
jgi:hypothetical protein